MPRGTAGFYKYALVYRKKKMYFTTLTALGKELGLSRSTVERMKKDKWEIKPPKVENIEFHVEEIRIPFHHLHLNIFQINIYV